MKVYHWKDDWMKDVKTPSVKAAVVNPCPYSIPSGSSINKK
jgi:hypothetical protein